MDEKVEITQFRQGSEQAFGRLYDRHWHSVCHFASLYLKRADEIEEVVQEVFIRLWEARFTLRDDSDLESFLFVVTRNLIFTRRRRSFDKSFYSLTIINALSDNSDTAHGAELNDLVERLEKLVDRMPAARKQVFEMSRRRYMSYREISSELGITEKTVERHINEALKYLKSHLIAILAVVSIFSANFFRSLWG
jgi:RNA polymerase sigma-70 factor (ECF subfamily)